MLISFNKYRSFVFSLLLVNFLFINGAPILSSILEVNKDQIVAYLDQDIETEKDQKEEESKEKKEYYIHQIDLVFQDEVRRQLNVLHFENFKNLIFPPFSPPPEYC